jgi:preprotein translocase subunit SecG
MLYSVLLTLHILVSVILVVLVLIQQGKGADAGAAFGAGGSGTVFGAGGAGNLLTRTTAVLAACFFVISLSLAYLTTQSVESRSVVDRVGPATESIAPDGASDVPAAPASSGTGGSSSDIPAAPSGGLPTSGQTSGAD